LAFIEQHSPDSPVVAFGFSLGGNLLLNTLAEIGSATGFPLEMAVAVCPPIDLITCSGFLRSGTWRVYDRFFIQALMKTLAERQKRFPSSRAIQLARKPTSLWDFDDAVTAPLSGYENAEAYYRATSPIGRLGAIHIPTLIFTADNDPLVPVAMFSQAKLGPGVSLQIASGGGHLGFISDGNSSSGRRDPDRRWLDWRLVEWAKTCEKSASPGPTSNQVLA
jgi:predicted alpha/beta-fold hydrolase